MRGGWKQSYRFFFFQEKKSFFECYFPIELQWLKTMTITFFSKTIQTNKVYVCFYISSDNRQLFSKHSYTHTHTLYDYVWRCMFQWLGHLTHKHELSKTFYFMMHQFTHLYKWVMNVAGVKLYWSLDNIGGMEKEIWYA